MIEWTEMCQLFLLYKEADVCQLAILILYFQCFVANDILMNFFVYIVINILKTITVTEERIFTVTPSVLDRLHDLHMNEKQVIQILEVTGCAADLTHWELE